MRFSAPCRYSLRVYFVAIFCLGLTAGCDEPLGFLGVEKVERPPERRRVSDDGELHQSRFAEEMQNFLARFKRDTREFARAEMARLNAAEGAYRGEVERHEREASGAIARTAVVVKLYRNYTGFEAPVRAGPTATGEVNLQIRFDYDLMSTRARASDDTGSAEAAALDEEYQLLRRGDLLRAYTYANRAGFNSVDSDPIPIRPGYFLVVMDEPEATEQELLAP